MAKVSCPRCAEKIQGEALVCRHCGHELTPDELDARAAKAKIDSWVKIGIGAVLLVGVVKCSMTEVPASNSAASSLSSSNSLDYSAPAVRKEARLDKFSWEAYGDTYCHANAKVTNTSTDSLPYVRIALQFFKNGKLVGSDKSYLDVTDLGPGQTSTWSAMYECPGRTAEVEITATSRGDAVILSDP
jgi:hypothetical protein